MCLPLQLIKNNFLKKKKYAEQEAKYHFLILITGSLNMHTYLHMQTHIHIHIYTQDVCTQIHTHIHVYVWQDLVKAMGQ